MGSQKKQGQDVKTQILTISIGTEGEILESKEIWLIAGLGNPGKKYEKTWHNLGYLALDYISQKHGIPVNRIKFKGLYGQGTIGDKKVVLLKPSTYMNNSGESLQEAAAYFGIDKSRILVIYDDIDIEKGKIRIRLKGSGGTHNGMRSVITHLDTLDFPRIRVGCGPLPERWNIVDYVLSKIPEESYEMVFESIEISCDAVNACLKYNVSKAMNMYNSNGTPGKKSVPSAGE